MHDKKCCDDNKVEGGFHGGHGAMFMDCCNEHAMSKEHLEAKKKMLEEKLQWVNEKLRKK